MFRKDRLAAQPDEELHWTEGEEHALALEELGQLATTTSGGAKGIRAYDPEELRWAAQDRHLVVHVDNDRDGDTYVAWLERIAGPVAASVRILRYPETGPGGDVLDWIRAGGTAEDLRRRLADVPVAKPRHENGSPRLIVARLSDVVTKPIEWLWHRRLARGKVHVLGGDYGDGKSTLMAWLAATLSTGGAWPDGGDAPLAKVLFLLLEDGIDDTLKPRLALHNADQDRIFALEAVADGEGARRVFRLDRHLDLLRAYVREQAIDLIIIDPVSAFMTGTNRDTEGTVRDVLTPLVDLANELGVAIMALMHTGKPGMGTAGRKPTQRLLRSTAFPAVARVVWMLAPTPDDPGRKVLAVTKSNLDLKPDPLEWSRALDQPIVWHGVSEHDIDQLFDAIKPMPREGAKAWLVEALAGGDVPQRIVETRARELGISPATLKRAREELGVMSHKQTGVVNAPWLWRLPKRHAQLEVKAPEGEVDPPPSRPSVPDADAAAQPAKPAPGAQDFDRAATTLSPVRGDPPPRTAHVREEAHPSYASVSFFGSSPASEKDDRRHSRGNRDGRWKELSAAAGERLRPKGNDAEEAHPVYLQGELLRSPGQPHYEDSPP